MDNIITVIFLNQNNKDGVNRDSSERFKDILLSGFWIANSFDFQGADLGP